MIRYLFPKCFEMSDEMSFIALALFFLLLVSLCYAETGYFLHISDLHMDSMYKPGTSRDKRCVAGEGDAPSVVTYDCDISYDAVRGFLEKLKIDYPSPDFILYTGDTNAHYVDVGYATEYTKEDIYTVLKDGMTIMSDVYPGVPIYPIHGNHDNYPCNLISLEESGNEHLSGIADTFVGYIPDESVEMFRQKGYYTADINDTLRVIATTSDYWVSSNLYVLMTGGEFDHDILDNFEAELKKMREENKKAVWIGHQPLGHAETSYKDMEILPLIWKRLVPILEEYSDVLSFGSFAGHTHKNSYRIMMDKNNAPASVQYTTTSLGDYSNQNGGCNVFLYDKDTYKMLDVIMAYIKTDESNKAGEVLIDYFPSFIEEFGLPDLSATSLMDLYKSNVASKTGGSFEGYLARLFTNYQPKNVSNGLWGTVACGSGPIDEDNYQACYASLSSGKPFDYQQ